MSINNVILFVSSVSQTCVTPIKFIRENNIPVLIIRLDTIEDRVKAANGKYFKITEVPTLVILYKDGTLQLFIGVEKIMGWLNTVVQHNQVEEKPKKETKKVTFSDENEDDIDLLTKPKKSKKSKKTESKNSSIFNIAKQMEQERSSTLGYKEG